MRKTLNVLNLLFFSFETKAIVGFITFLYVLFAMGGAVTLGRTTTGYTTKTMACFLPPKKATDVPQDELLNETWTCDVREKKVDF
jgi:hypothetical protein